MLQMGQPKIFISYSWEEKPLVLRLEKELQAAGAQVWVDHEGIRGGDNLPERISEALEWCDTLTLVWTKAASHSRWVKLEWTNAISLEKSIIPCCVDNATLPAILAHKAYVDFSDVEAGLSQLLKALRLCAPSFPAQIQQAVATANSVNHSPLQEIALLPTATKPNIKNMLHLRSTPLKLSEAEVKTRYEFFNRAYYWNYPLHKSIIDNRFDLQQNGHVVFDQLTNLMWQQSGSFKRMKFSNAEHYVSGLNKKRFAGFSDWRLPTVEEMMSLMEREKKNEDLYINSMFDKMQRYVWTADKYSAVDAVWIVYFYDGPCLRPGFRHAYVRLVR